LVHTTHNNKPITIEPNSIPAETYTYTGSDIEPAITVKHPVVGSTRILEKNTDYTVSYSNNRNAGTNTAKVTITGINDYTGSKDIPFTINKAAGAAVSAPTFYSTSSYYSTTINAVTAPTNGQSVEYGISTTNNAATVTTWQDGLDFSVRYGLIDYQFIFARSKEDNNHHAGAASAGLSVVIPMSLDPSNFIIAFSSLPENNAATPYTFKANDNKWPNLTSVDGFDKLAEKNPNKYFSIDLSDGTLDYIDTFSNCTTLVSVILPNSVTDIWQSAFRGCTSLTSITLGNGLTTIGSGAFYNCTSLTSIIIPNSVTSIASTTFFGCRSLTSVTIGSGVASIGNLAFSGCSSLTSVRFERANTAGSNTFPNGASLQTAYTAGGIGTYTREANGTTWTKISD